MILGNNILNDDFLTYPYEIRSTESDLDYFSYLRHVTEKNFLDPEDEVQVRMNEIDNLADFHIRVYIDYDLKLAFIMGYIHKSVYFEKPIIKRMTQQDKSEKAVYFAVNLRKGRSVNDFSLDW